MRTPRIVALGLLAAVVFAVPPVQARVGNAARGRTLAVEACSACHKVTRDQAAPAPVHNADTLEEVTAPSFFEIARKYRARTRSPRAFVVTPEHPMREQRFLRRDLDDIVAYIRARGTAK